MGTTLDAIRSDEGAQFAFALLIEGYENLIVSDVENIATSAWENAYSATDWLFFDANAVIGGLYPPEEVGERIEIFKGETSVTPVRLVVAPDQDDTFGIDTHRLSPSDGNKTELTADIDSDDTTITVADTTGFASSGTIWIGTERIDYSAKTATTFTVSRRGTFAPFKSDTEASQRFGRPHTLINESGASFRPAVTDYPRVWAGRLVRLVVHRVVGGVPDTLAQAETIFSGFIQDISDSGNGNIVIDCSSILDILNQRTLLEQQFRGKIREGIRLNDGDYIEVREYFSATSTLNSERLTVVSGTPGANEIAEGYITVDDLLGEVEEMIDGAGFTGDATLSTVPLDTGETRVRLTMGGYSSGQDVEILLMFSNEDIASFFGFTRTINRAAFSPGSLTEYRLDSPRAPLRIKAFQGGDGFLDFEGTSGAWVEVDPELQPVGRNGSDYGYIRIGDGIARVRYATTSFDSVQPSAALQATLGVGAFDPASLASVSYDDPGDLEFQQVVILRGTIKEIFARVLLSTGTLAYNETTYDSLDGQLGVGLPYEAFGDDFVESLDKAQSIGGSSATLVIDKPTRFGEFLAPELALRNIYIVPNGAGLEIKSPSTPSSDSSFDHTLDVESRATTPGSGDPGRVETSRTSDLLVNKVTVEFNRSIGDRYRSSRTVINAASRTDHGKIYPLTIRARNSYGNDAILASTVEEAITQLAAVALGYFSNEATLATVPVNRSHFDIKPGDLVALTDDSVRDPDTGLRGVVSRPGWVLSISRNWSEGIAGLQLVMLPQNDVSQFGTYSPSGRVTTYNTGTGVATIATSVYSTASDPDDITNFQVGDKIRFIELSPSNTASPSTWVDEVDSIDVGAAEITTVSNNGNGVYDSSKAYVVYADDFATVQTSQKIHAFIADDADLKVNGSAPYLYGLEFPSPDAISVTDELYRYPADINDDEGEPLATHLHSNLILNLNNFVRFRSAPTFPQVSGRLQSSTAYWESDTQQQPLLVLCMPYYFGPGTGVTRKLYVQPLADFGGADATSWGTIYFDLTALTPGDGDGTTTFHNRNPTGFRTSVQFIGSGASLTRPAAAGAEIVGDLNKDGVGILSVYLLGGTDGPLGTGSAVKTTLYDFAAWVGPPE